jgi:hypothetical protein
VNFFFRQRTVARTRFDRFPRFATSHHGFKDVIELTLLIRHSHPLSSLQVIPPGRSRPLHVIPIHFQSTPGHFRPLWHHRPTISRPLRVICHCMAPLSVDHGHHHCHVVSSTVATTVDAAALSTYASTNPNPRLPLSINYGSSPLSPRASEVSLSEVFSTHRTLALPAPPPPHIFKSTIIISAAFLLASGARPLFYLTLPQR